MKYNEALKVTDGKFVSHNTYYVRVSTKLPNGDRMFTQMLGEFIIMETFIGINLDDGAEERIGYPNYIEIPLAEVTKLEMYTEPTGQPVFGIVIG
jgi:hypothetical protein